MKFRVGDRVVIDPAAGINCNGSGNIACSKLLGGTVHVIQCFNDDNLVLDGIGSRYGYLPERFMLAPKDDYFEPCSTYRACTDENGDYVVEAVRVKLIARCPDEAEAKRIADALNTTRNS